jgi:hypothetical protein
MRGRHGAVNRPGGRVKLEYHGLELVGLCSLQDYVRTHMLKTNVTVLPARREE